MLVASNHLLVAFVFLSGAGAGAGVCPVCVEVPAVIGSCTPSSPKRALRHTRTPCGRSASSTRNDQSMAERKRVCDLSPWLLL